MPLVYSMSKVKTSNNSVQDKLLYDLYNYLVGSESKKYKVSFDFLLNHQFTRDKTLALIISCDSEV